MALSDQLKALAKLPRTSTPFLSLYLNARWDSEKQREKVRIFVKNEIKECLANAPAPEASRSLDEDTQKIDNYVKGLVNREWDEGYGGVAVFACSGLGVYEVVRSHMPFESLFTCSNRPTLRPAADQAHSGEPAVLAMVSGDSGRLIEFEMGGLRRQFSFVDEDFPGRHDQGGWSQARYQRHVEEHLTRNVRRLGDHLTRWVDERRIGRVVLSGASELLGAFEDGLPKRVREAVKARLHLDPNAAPDVVQEEALTALARTREEEDRRAVGDLFGKIVGTGRAVVGPDPVARAVRAGQVRILYIHRGFREPGWKCFGCGAAGIKIPLGCPECGLAAEAVELGEELIRGTLASDGRVVPVADHDGLRSEGGVAALLRFA